MDSQAFGFVLQIAANNGSNNLTVSASGSFNFYAQVLSGSAYSVGRTLTLKGDSTSVQPTTQPTKCDVLYDVRT
jgi:hypothetical protein